MFAVSGAQLGWLLGAGASASGGIPTAGQLLDEFKALLYASENNLDRSDVRMGDPLIGERVRRFFDNAHGLPRIGSPDEYAAAFELAFPDPAVRRQWLERWIAEGRPTFGHRVVAVLMASGLIRWVATTNFDDLVERAYEQLRARDDSFAASTVAAIDSVMSLAVRFRATVLPRRRRSRSTTGKVRRRDLLCSPMALNLRGAEFIGTFGEMTGYKSGLALTEDRFREIFVEGGYEEFWPDDPDSWLRIRSERVEEIFAFALYKLGVGPSKQVVSPLIFVYHRVKDDPRKLKLMKELSPRFTDFLREAVDVAKKNGTRKIDPRPFLDQAVKDNGADGLEIALMIAEAMITHQLQSPWSALRRVEWQDVRQLDELFTSERLASPHGEYFDERFASFLASNFDEIDRINWRQFEGLAAEFFKRVGFSVELGPGRNDDGVDIRLWPTEAPDGSPAVILVQCKRQKAKIDKLVVKGLWADMVAEGAESGLIVTTSTLAPGATTTRTARGYEIAEADRHKVREFVNALRTPGAGTFLGE